MSAYKKNHFSLSTGQTMRVLGKTQQTFSRGENAQALVIIALAFFTLLAFCGLVTM